MTTLALHRLEQEQAHYRDFLRWWWKNIRPHLGKPYDAQLHSLSQDLHWKEYRRQKGLDHFPKP